MTMGSISRAARAALAAVLLAASFIPRCAAQGVETGRVNEAIEVFNAIAAMPDSQVPAALMRRAYGIAVIPRVQRVSFIVGIQRGRGVLVTRGGDGTWSRPLFVSLSGGSVGWQAGVQSADIVLFFRTRDSVEEILRGGSTLGVTASIAAGSVGRDASAVTDADLHAEVYSYSRTRGIFAGVAVQGGVIAIDYDANGAYYGKEITRAEQVFQGSGLPEPPSAAQLRREIHAYEKSLR
jgi:lipid-binding SYLF domain-containing protein